MEHTWEKYKAILTGVGNTLLKRKAIEDVAADRRKICDSCPSKKRNCAPMISECCGVCGCSLSFKTRVLTEKCPSNKWPALEE
jgi:hypothetical protein